MIQNSFFLIVFLALLAALAGMSTDIYLPALPSMVTQLHATTAQGQHTITMFFVGISISQLFIGPLADRFGRKPILVVGLIVYLIATVVCVSAPNIEIIIFARLFQAIGACTGTVCAYAIARDKFSQQKNIQVMAQMTAALGFAAMISPPLGSILQTYFNWHADFIFLGLIGFCLLLVTIFILQETMPAKDSSSMMPRQVYNNFRQLFSSWNYMAYALTGSIIFAIFFCFILNFPFLLITTLHVSTIVFGILYAVAAGAYSLGGIATKYLAAYWSRDKILIWGLSITLGGTALAVLVSSLFSLSVLGLMLPFMIAVIGLAMVLATSSSGAMQPFPELAGTAAALFNFLRFMLSFITGLFVSLLNLTDSLSTSVLMLTLGMLATVIFIAYAMPTRHREKFDA